MASLINTSNRNMLPVQKKSELKLIIELVSKSVIYFEMLNNLSTVQSQKPDQGQSKAVGAQIGKWSGQQYQSGMGQQPTGHEVSSGPHWSWSVLANFTSWTLLVSKGQSSAVAAQPGYAASGQQNQFSSGGTGQQPLGHGVISGSHCPVFGTLINCSLSSCIL